ncbi:MAG: lytic transglycosylase domain-containing protein [Acidobacteriota bacterium]
MRRKWLVISIVAALAIGLTLVRGYYWFARSPDQLAKKAAQAGPKPQAPPDLEKLRSKYKAGVQALDRNDGAAAVKELSSFDFGGRVVEEYRLSLLARAQDLAGDHGAQRATLATLWLRGPRLVQWADAGMKLSGLYSERGDFAHAAKIANAVATRSFDPAIAAAARWQAVESAFYKGDVAGVLQSGREIVIKAPRSQQAAAAIALVRAMSGGDDNGSIPLTPEERLERAVSLLRDGDPQDAYDELQALRPDAPSSLHDPIELNMGLALFQLRRFEDAIKTLEPLTSGSYRFAIPALYHASKSYRVLANSINPMVSKTTVQRQQVGTVKVRSGKGKKAKTTTRPKFANVKKTVQLVDLARKAKKDSYDHLANERLKDLLSLPLSPPVRIEVLNTLIAGAEAKNQDAFEQSLIKEVVKLDPLSDPGLQHFWDDAWDAYVRGDMVTAKALLQFIRETYMSPNVRRQATYWYARAVERSGGKAEATELYRVLANAPYDDVYALDAQAHGAKRQALPPNPLKINRPDWRDIAEQSMPANLKLAYELTALSDMRNARLEIQKNMNRENQPFADALLADLYNSSGDTDLLYRTLRRAFPSLATVDQDSVPPYFLKMYYPMKFEDTIRKNGKRFGVDPYLVMGLILQESYFNPKAKSRVGATGLMQLMPPTAKELARRLHGPFGTPHLENPENNIELGTAHFKDLINLFHGNTQLAIASYNAGQGNVMKWRRTAPNKPMDEFLEAIPFPETRNYVKRVTLISATYRRMSE